jgi:hypothetical protein
MLMPLAGPAFPCEPSPRLGVHATIRVASRWLALRLGSHTSWVTPNMPYALRYTPGAPVTEAFSPPEP